MELRPPENAPGLSEFLHWVKERETIRLLKESGAPRPWTQDLILEEWKFTNVRRRDDRVSRWICEHVLTLPVPEGPMGLYHLGMFLALGRFANWPPTIQAFLHAKMWPSAQPDWVGMGNLIDTIAATGAKAWTGAYMTRAESNPAAPWYHWGKGRYIADIVVCRELTTAADRLQAALGKKTRRAVSDVLRTCYGWAPFMAGQVIDDWSWTPLLRDATDHDTWAPQGPGSIRGLNRVLGRPLTSRFEDTEWQERLMALRAEIIKELGIEFADLTLMDVENCLCETDKHLRVKNGEGTPRSKYKPETAY